MRLNFLNGDLLLPPNRKMRGSKISIFSTMLLNRTITEEFDFLRGEGAKDPYL